MILLNFRWQFELENLFCESWKAGEKDKEAEEAELRLFVFIHALMR